MNTLLIIPVFSLLCGCESTLLDIATAPMAVFSGGEYHETAANKALRQRNEADVAQYWKDRGINPDTQ